MRFLVNDAKADALARAAWCGLNAFAEFLHIYSATLGLAAVKGDDTLVAWGRAIAAALRVMFRSTSPGRSCTSTRRLALSPLAKGVDYVMT